MATKKKASKQPERGTATTSISVQDPAVIVEIKRAADLKGESMSKFILAAAGAEAARVLKGKCPGCGRSMHGVKKAA
jgi:uncharacterized protein (DUF1778 family)